MISARINAATMMAPAYSRVLRLKADFASILAVDPDDDSSDPVSFARVADAIVS